MLALIIINLLALICVIITVREPDNIKLTVGQRISLIFVWFIWIRMVMEAKIFLLERGEDEGDWHKYTKTWYKVKKGMEKHKHVYSIKQKNGFLGCEHEGCSMCVDPICLFCKWRVKVKDSLSEGRCGNPNQTSPFLKKEVWATDKCNLFEDEEKS